MFRWHHPSASALRYVPLNRQRFRLARLTWGCLTGQMPQKSLSPEAAFRQRLAQAAGHEILDECLNTSWATFEINITRFTSAVSMLACACSYPRILDA